MVHDAETELQRLENQRIASVNLQQRGPRMGTELSRPHPCAGDNQYSLLTAALLAALLAAGCSEDRVDVPAANGAPVTATPAAAAGGNVEAPVEPPTGSTEGPVPATTTTAEESPGSPAGESATGESKPPTAEEIDAALSRLPASIPAEMKEHVYALQKLQAGFDFGVGDKLIEVDLDGSPVTDVDLAHVAALPDLRILNLSNTKITDAGLEQITKLERIKFLYLFNTEITDAGVAHLKELPRLEVLCLDRTQITDVGLKTLEELPRLERLHVHSRAPITDAGLESLKKHTRLFELRVGGPNITEQGVEALRKALPNCQVVYDKGEEASED
jgi:hypothetical protein